MHSNGNSIDIKNYKRGGALHTKDVQHLSSVLFSCLVKDRIGFALRSLRSPSWAWRKKRWGTNPPKSWVVHVMLSAARPLGSAVVVNIRLGSAWSSQARFCHSCVSPPPYTHISYATAVPWILLWDLGAGIGRNTSLYFVHLHISVLERNDCLMLQPGAKLLDVIVTPERLWR